MISMKNKSLLSLFSFFTLTLSIVFILNSCNKKFDEPPVEVPEEIVPDLTISQLKAMHVAGAFENITEDKTIGAVVVADDKSGNYYKTLVLQDETGGIELKLDGYDLYTSYPVGRKIYIKVKGLTLGDYNKLPQLGIGVDETGTSPRLGSIPSALFDQYIIKGSTDNTITPKVTTVAALTDADLNTVIQLEDFQFAVTDTSKTYGDTSLASSAVNFTVKSCSNQSITLRNSSYADFAGYNVPNGKGTLLAIYNVFGSTKQLKIRDTSDVRFNGDRCGSGPVSLISIADVRSLFASGQTEAPTGKSIEGIVISDRSKGNINSQNIVLQEGDGKAGICVRFTAVHSFNVGDKLQINISGLTLSEFSGWLQINSTPLDNAAKTGTGSIAPRVVTAQSLTDNFEAWESTLVSLQNVTLSGGSAGTYNGTVTVTDATGSVPSATSSSATFKDSLYPGGTVTSFTGYVTQVNSDKRVNLRSAADVTGGTQQNNGTTIFSEAFTSVTNNVELNISGWVNVAETGTKKYSGGTFSGSAFAKISAFSAAQPVIKSWLVTPAISLGSYATKTFTFTNADGYDNGATLKVYISTNYTGGTTPWTSAWTQLPATISSGHTTGYGSFISSGAIDLSSYSGSIRLAFVYEGADPSSGTKATTTFEIDDVKVMGK